MEKYLKRLFELDRYISKLTNLMSTQSVDSKNREDYYLINKDIIARYLESDIYEKVHISNINNSDSNVDTFLQNFNLTSEEKKLLKEEEKNEKKIIESFLEPEQLLIKYVEIPNNFFIIDKTVYESFKDYYQLSSRKVYIGKEGIFIERKIKLDNDHKFLVYFIKSMNELDLDEFKINKVYIFDEEADFFKELDTKIKGKTIEQYFASRGFLNKGGISNMNDDGKKIFMYINMNRIEKYESKSKELDELNRNGKYIEKFIQGNK